MHKVLHMNHAGHRPRELSALAVLQ